MAWAMAIPALASAASGMIGQQQAMANASTKEGKAYNTLGALLTVKGIIDGQGRIIKISALADFRPLDTDVLMLFPIITKAGDLFGQCLCCVGQFGHRAKHVVTINQQDGIF